MRESTLKAASALISFKDEYRKAFVDQDVMPLLVESLTSTPTKPRSSRERPRSPPKEDEAAPSPETDPAYGGNTAGVMIAACHVVRMLSRSVSILRTTLQDAGVSAPLFRLLRIPRSSSRLLPPARYATSSSSPVPCGRYVFPSLSSCTV